MNLSLFQKPSRYINNEVNSLHKNAEIRVALAFPDIYDVGMSHLGLRILYKIINDLPYASAERVFHPWLDMEKELRHKDILLSSLETGRPLKDFDIVGFSLQYELSYTSVLNMLHLGGIPLHTEERITGNRPLIIAGGPCTVNPLPMSPFIDAFLIGDGEEAIAEILDLYRKWKKEGDGKRESLFKALLYIEGIFVPSIHLFTNSPIHHINRRFIESLDSSPYPDVPIVPYTSIVHDRVNIEVSRGCTMGCRFCQAGMIYRPLRERSPKNVLRIAEASLKNTGYEEVSFTSLSAGDYSCLLPLLKEFNRRFSDKKIALSLPSLRVAAVNQNILKEIKSIRKTGFTIAPEAATERLRNVINKDFAEEDYERALKALFEEGWHNLKLYFMVGLPTETNKDIEAIPEMALKALRVAKTHTGRYVNINITISPFVPKPHTPFQWHGQENIDRIKEKMKFLKDIFYKKRLKYKGHNEEMSLLEAVFARGDKRLSELIEKAWSLCCRLDAWTESFDFNRWLKAMEATGIDASVYAEKIYKEDEPLHWDIIDTGIKKEYLYEEYKKSILAEKTADCRKACHACGLECKEVKGERLKVESFKTLQPEPSTFNLQPSTLRLRVEFSKTGKLRYLSHLEMVTAILRALRRADIPVIHSQGFHPSPKVSFGPALSVGVAGIREYFDMEIISTFDIDYIMHRINSVLPEGLKIRDMELISDREPSLSSFISRYEYEVRYNPPQSPLNKGGSKGGYQASGIRHHNIEDITVIDKKTVRLTLIDHENKNVRLGELLSEIFPVPFGELDIIRLSMYGWSQLSTGQKSRWITPMQAITMQNADCRLQIANLKKRV